MSSPSKSGFSWSSIHANNLANQQTHRPNHTTFSSAVPTKINYKGPISPPSRQRLANPQDGGASSGWQNWNPQDTASLAYTTSKSTAHADSTPTPAVQYTNMATDKICRELDNTQEKIVEDIKNLVSSMTDLSTNERPKDTPTPTAETTTTTATTITTTTTTTTTTIANSSHVDPESKTSESITHSTKVEVSAPDLTLKEPHQKTVLTPEKDEEVYHTESHTESSTTIVSSNSQDAKSPVMENGRSDSATAVNEVEDKVLLEFYEFIRPDCKETLYGVLNQCRIPRDNCEVRWVDKSRAIAKFGNERTAIQAKEALGSAGLFKIRRYSGTFDIKDPVYPSQLHRPLTTNSVARRLIHGALGLRAPVRTKEERERDHTLLRIAREEKEARFNPRVRHGLVDNRSM
ncbi:hypothetical protein J3Q64DRAFT_1724530 [Phycomyces blakesleeanus]|uniref:RRM domain-containing protein n=2 Tax=Phycomyces blakesleeanus TaxID=4837 RepID=A0A167RGK7_PHYB8|nr:hypothetical protein PHYBLDRAFT_76740 [Phycomyces blakesleeanus NRRL 1555(-)]OAD81576.1 hypothetical protein PHYBLDRAFT_76740 [Phycomyces blakesleeanus NRRL 1555(-)]|eukprot:XP_018299616.1 hypothetical protein PHYBLDRAFT_76740 [Phycomyces blakesleeanus NRRL 1555(-)]